MTALLKISDVNASYGPIPALKGVDLEVQEGELRVILGANGAGKTTIIKAILGLVKVAKGSIQFAGKELAGMPAHKIHQLGIAWVPEGRQLWGSLTVLDNIKMGVFGRESAAGVPERIEEMFDRFPRLRERQNQLAGSLSGGEQQMLAIVRAVVSNPKLLLMDEPSLGLAPLVVRDVFSLARRINGAGMSILMVEQNARQALRIAHYAYLLEVGRIVTGGTAQALAASKEVQEIFLGGKG